MFVQQELANARTFMVGCGALGCEFLKNFAMLGVACGPDGLVTTTDNDRIEISNLSRQFLFREHNVGQSKAAAASAAVREMNPDIKVCRVCAKCPVVAACVLCAFVSKAQSMALG